MAPEEERDQSWNLRTCKLCSYRSKSSFVMCQHVRLNRTRPKTDTFVCDSKTPEMIQCKFCYFDTDLKVKLKEHFRVIHEGEEANDQMENILKPLLCRNGDFETNSLLVLTKHEVNCNRRFNGTLEQKPNLNTFKKRRYVDEVRCFECAQCLYRGKRKSNLKSHIFGKHTSPKDLNDDDLFKCTQCSFKTKYKYCLKRHILFWHLNSEDVNWFKCTKCSFKSKFKASLKRHVSLHILKEQCDPEDINWFRCTECSYRSKSRQSLKSHVLMQHLNSKWFRCAQCSFATKFKSNLKFHIATQHLNPEDINWFKCAQCSFKSKQKVHLKSHILLIHSNPEDINWFHCGECSYKTKYRSNLRKHILRKHLN